jgi:hypothetical protein
MIFLGSLSIVGVGFAKIPPYLFDKGAFYVWFQVLLILGMPNSKRQKLGWLALRHQIPYNPVFDS